MKEIYFPMSARVLTMGHILCLEWLAAHGFVTVGLLTAEALKGYKEEVVPFKERKYILETIGVAIGNIDVIPQDSLDPSANLKKTKYDAIASGDGFEPAELRAAKKFGLELVNIKLYGEKGKKRYSSSKILKS